MKTDEQLFCDINEDLDMILKPFLGVAFTDYTLSNVNTTIQNYLQNRINCGHQEYTDIDIKATVDANNIHLLITKRNPLAKF